jgi:uncharacterized RmlC-like cupin family protein
MEGNTMHEVLEKSPVTWGGMTMALMKLPAGTDATPLLKGLPGDLCQCEHWGYMLEGSIHIKYADGAEEVVKAGDVFYFPAGHTGWTTDEDVAWVEVSPAKEYGEVMAHVAKMQEKLAQEGG